MGLNPSVSKNERSRLENADPTVPVFYDLKGDVVNEYRYFNKFYDFADKVGVPWEHIDLFYLKETQQKNYKKF